LASVVVVLYPNPSTVLRPGTAVSYLTSLEERLQLLRRLGVDSAGIIPFTSELAQLSARDFASLLVEELSMRLLYVGPDFALGRRREGIVGVLRKVGGDMGFRVETAELLAQDGEKVGSSAVRQALAAGDIEEVARLLGRPFTLSGPVVAGAHRGVGLGFPTANIAIGLDRALPAFGVYVTRAFIGENEYLSCTNIGVRPTFDSEPRPTVEAFILDFDDDIYGQDIRIDLLHRLRDELRFDSVDDLVTQMHRDIADTREYFREHAP
ncbi:MAG: riboflavin biosynthesis protein RibF, partial [Chloroflexi bacterium]|nr:riboflavin biosynthesis protein RibF [Chloroflexota bacterium]